MADKDYIEILEKEIYERFLKIKEEYQSDYPEYTHDFDHLEESLRHELNLVSYRIDTHNNVKEHIAELIEDLDEETEMSLLNPDILNEIAEFCDVNLDFKKDEKPPYKDYIVTISFYANNGKDCYIDFGGHTKEELLKHIHDFMDKDFQECREEDKAFWANQYDSNNTFYKGLSLDEVLEDVEEERKTYEKIAEYFIEFEKQAEEKELEKEIKHSITGSEKETEELTEEEPER